MSTDFQGKLYDFITGYLQEKGASPAFSEMTAGLGLSPRSKSLISRSLYALEKEGRLQLMKSGRRLLISLPLKSLVFSAALEADSPLTGVLTKPWGALSHLFNQEAHFILQVKGAALAAEGLCEGDFIVGEPVSVIPEGEKALVLIDQKQLTLKRISYQIKNSLTLISADPTLKPRAYPPERISIQGRYLGFLRLNNWR